MAKIKTAFFCQNCGHQTSKWLGKCPSCSEWNTFVEEIISSNDSSVVAFSTSNGKTAKPQIIQNIEQNKLAEIIGIF